MLPCTVRQQHLLVAKALGDLMCTDGRALRCCCWASGGALDCKAADCIDEGAEMSRLHGCRTRWGLLIGLMTSGILPASERR